MGSYFINMNGMLDSWGWGEGGQERTLHYCSSLARRTKLLQQLSVDLCPGMLDSWGGGVGTGVGSYFIITPPQLVEQRYSYS